MAFLSHEQSQALKELKFHIPAWEINGKIDRDKWIELRKKINRTFRVIGRERMTLRYNFAAQEELRRGVPIAVVARRHKLSRTTIYRIIRDDPVLSAARPIRKRDLH